APVKPADETCSTSKFNSPGHKGGGQPLSLFEIALVLVRLDHVASFVVNANHGIVRPAIMFCVSDCIRDGIRPVMPQTTEWQHIGDEINTAFIFARGSDFVRLLQKS